nr:hypothetical protein [Dendronalium sp. ChiSLP03b]MDZ8203439.1 hypothetical protein [Dendronalium sp. ChiSLP03b]
MSALILTGRHFHRESSSKWQHLDTNVIHSPTGNRRIISCNATASPSGVYTTSPDIAITILCRLAHSKGAIAPQLSCCASGFRSYLQAATNTASGDLIPFQVRSASLK